MHPGGLGGVGSKKSAKVTLAGFLCYHSGSMNSRRRLFSYVILNICVSALVTGTILFLYNRSAQKDCSPTAAAGSTGTPASSEGIGVAIISIAGAGTLDGETATIQNNGESTLVLTGWTLKSDAGATYLFPQLTLYPGGVVQVHSGSGADTASDLFWQRTSAVWSSGELASLYDTQNIARAFYRIP